MAVDYLAQIRKLVEEKGRVGGILEFKNRVNKIKETLNASGDKITPENAAIYRKYIESSEAALAEYEYKNPLNEEEARRALTEGLEVLVGGPLESLEAPAPTAERGGGGGGGSAATYEVEGARKARESINWRKLGLGTAAVAGVMAATYLGYSFKEHRAYDTTIESERNGLKTERDDLKGSNEKLYNAVRDLLSALSGTEVPSEPKKIESLVNSVVEQYNKAAGLVKKADEFWKRGEKGDYAGYEKALKLYSSAARMSPRYKALPREREEQMINSISGSWSYTLVLQEGDDLADLAGRVGVPESVIRKVNPHIPEGPLIPGTEALFPRNPKE